MQALRVWHGLCREPDGAEDLRRIPGERHGFELDERHIGDERHIFGDERHLEQRLPLGQQFQDELAQRQRDGQAGQRRGGGPPQWRSDRDDRGGSGCGRTPIVTHERKDWDERTDLLNFDAGAAACARLAVLDELSFVTFVAW